MTPSTKRTTRLTSAYVRDKGIRPVVVTVVGGIIELRAKGLRQVEVADVASLYLRLVRERVAREKAERKAKRKEKRA